MEWSDIDPDPVESMIPVSENQARDLRRSESAAAQAGTIVNAFGFG
jgi:hypothetical protein